MNQLILATSNPHKVAELTPALQQYDFHVRPQTEFFSEQVEEDGASFIENALKKARFASQKTGLPALADDSGLLVDYLQGQPGLFSARYAQTGAGQKVDDQTNRQKLLAALDGLAFKDRKAHYYCAVVYVQSVDDPTPIIGTGIWHGEILMEERTTYGVGYDPIMWIPAHVRAASEINAAVKAKVSHRAQALQQVLAQLT